MSEGTHALGAVVLELWPASESQEGVIKHRPPGRPQSPSLGRAGEG